MSSLPPPSHTVDLSPEHATEVSLEPEVPTIILRSSSTFTKKHLLHRQRQSRIPSTYSPIEALQTGSLSYSSTTHYRPASPTSSSSLREFLPIPDAIARTQTYALLEPFLFPLLFPLGCCTAILQSIYMVLPIFPAAIIVGIAGSIIVPMIFLGTISVTAIVVLKAIFRMVEQKLRALMKIGGDVVGAVERVAKLYRDAVVMLRCLARGRSLDGDDGRTTSTTATTERKPFSRSSLKPGPSILKPTRPLPVQVYEELPPSPLPLSTPTVRPRSASFGGSSTSLSGMGQATKAKDVFRSQLMAEKEKIQAQIDITNTNIQLPTPPSSDHTPSPPFNALDIPPYSSSYDDRAASPPPTHYFTNPRYSVSSIDLLPASNSTATSSYAPTPRTPGSPLVQQSRTVKHVRIVEPGDEPGHGSVVYFYDDDILGEQRTVFSRGAVAKLQDALGLLGTGAGQVWGS